MANLASKDEWDTLMTLHGQTSEQKKGTDRPLMKWKRESRAFSFTSASMFYGCFILLQSKSSLKIQALLPFHLGAGGSSCLSLGTIILQYLRMGVSGRLIFHSAFMKKNSFSSSAWRVLHWLPLPCEERSIWNDSKKNMHIHFNCFLFQLLQSEFPHVLCKHIFPHLCVFSPHSGD